MRMPVRDLGRNAQQPTSASAAIQCQPVNIAANPNGTTALSNGTMIRFALSPVNETRWKSLLAGSANPIWMTAEIKISSGE